MTTMCADVQQDADVLRQVLAGWEYQYGAAWIDTAALWTECTCAPSHDSPTGCDMTCQVCEVLDRLVYSDDMRTAAA